MLNDLADSSQRIGLRMNLDKTKVMFNEHVRPEPIAVQGSILEVVKENITSTSEAIDMKEDLKPWTEIPGPSSWPLLGPIRHFLPGGEFYNTTGFDIIEILYKNYGPIVRFDAMMGRETMIMLFDAESASQVIRAENNMPIRPGFQSLEYYRKHYKKDRIPDQPTGLITDHMEKWKEFRSAVNPVLIQPKRIQLYKSVLDEVSLDMIKRIKSLRDDKNILQGAFDYEMNLWALESISVVALGTRLGCLDPNLPKESKAHELITCVHDVLNAANELDFKPSLWRIISTPQYRKGMKLYEKQETLNKYFIDQAMKEFSTKIKNDDEKGILEKLLEINEEYAYIMANDMLLAGVDTVANTVTATLYLLATNQDKQQKLREELSSDTDKLSYLRACIKESMRMMPVVAGTIRKTTREYNILGYKIPSEMSVVFCHQQMSLMEENFVHPNEYIPERWLVNQDDPLSSKHAKPLAYNPFGFGARSCVGRRIADLEMELLLTRLIENFQVEWFGPPPKVEQELLSHIKGPFNFIFNDVKK